MESLDARLLIDTGETAATTIHTGAADAALGALSARFGGKVDIRPDFSGKRLEGHLRIAVSVKTGAALRAVIDEYL